jgi:glycosyltransferase involved in cell wall biosynthesis
MNISLVGVVPTLLLGKRIVASHQGGYHGIGLRGSILEGAKRTLTRFVTNISCSNYIARQIPGRSIVVPNAYDDRLFQLRDVAQRSVDFVFCGRLVSDKGADLLIRAFARVAAAASDTQLTIVGDGPERDALAQMAASLGVLDRIRFAGALRNQALVEELKKHRCMVVPSVWEEPFGIVALEGVACCDTIIVTNRGGLPEAAGPCGIVVEPTADNLAAAMLNVATARAKGRTLPQRPTEDVRMAHLSAHRPEVVAARYLEVVEVAHRGRH